MPGGADIGKWCRQDSWISKLLLLRCNEFILLITKSHSGIGMCTIVLWLHALALTAKMCSRVGRGRIGFTLWTRGGRLDMVMRTGCWVDHSWIDYVSSGCEVGGTLLPSPWSAKAKTSERLVVTGRASIMTRFRCSPINHGKSALLCEEWEGKDKDWP